MINDDPPGSHPHADQRNWQPATTVDDYLRNCGEGLETYSERKVAKLIGVSRVALWRWKMMAEIPDNLFDRLLKQDRKPSQRELAKVGMVLAGRSPASETEHCPHCGGLLRIRAVSKGTAKVVMDWLEEQTKDR